eukprot:scaffold1112_cov116-Isochrysis_galbana.AAC.49
MLRLPARGAAAAPYYRSQKSRWRRRSISTCRRAVCLCTKQFPSTPVQQVAERRMPQRLRPRGAGRCSTSCKLRRSGAARARGGD